jgi:antitoxin (DNA-binding transcriptional repressor) of toxin-antitoxin stability system
LKQRASELVRMVHETGKEVQITYRGQVVALLIPVKRAQKDDKTPGQNSIIWLRRSERAGPKVSPPRMRSLRRGDNIRRKVKTCKAKLKP